MEKFKLTTAAIVINGLLMMNNASAELITNDDIEGVISGSGALNDGGEYKIISVAGEENIITVANNGSVKINNSVGTPIIYYAVEFEDGDHFFAHGAVIVANSGTINLGSGSTVSQVIGRDLLLPEDGAPFDVDYDFTAAVLIDDLGGSSSEYLAKKGMIVADNLTINAVNMRDDKFNAGIYSDKYNGEFTLTGTTTVNTAATGKTSSAFGVYAKEGTLINADDFVLNSQGTYYAAGMVSEASNEENRSLIRYNNATVTTVADQYADGINANGGHIEASGDTHIDLTVNDENGEASGIWVSNDRFLSGVDSTITTAGTTSILLKTGADNTVFHGVDSMGSTRYTGNDLSIVMDTQGHQNTVGNGLFATNDSVLTAGKIDINGRFDIDVVDTTRSGEWHYVHAEKGGEITLNGEVQMGVNYNDPDTTAIFAENADSRVTINPQKVTIVGSLASTDSALIDVSANNHSRFDGGVSASDNGVVNLRLADNSVWNMTKDSQLTSLSLTDSTLNFMHTAANSLVRADNASAFKTLVVDGDYTGSNGNIVMNTQLGDDSSPTDRMVITGNTSGTSTVTVLNAGGKGGLTTDGIELISVGGNSDGLFKQDGRIVAGAYDYTLQRGEGTNEKNWYLSSALTPVPPAEPEEPDVPEEPDTPVSEEPAVPETPAAPQPAPREHAVRPEAGLYSMNLQAANTLFNTRLQDRLGETHYVDAITGQQAVTSLWLRNVGGHTRQKDASGQLSMQGNRYVMQLGGDVAQWSSDDSDRYHLGVMAGYANQKTRASNQRNGNRADSSISGYSVGLYGTWLQDQATQEGAYVDTWAQYSWFDNTVSGRGIASEKYDSKGFTASVESGYTWKVAEVNERNALYIQPKAQVTWMGVKADNHKETNGTRVEGSGDGNVQSRVGVRLFSKGHSQQDSGKDRLFQPFVEANWIHNTNNFGVSMNGERVELAGTRNVGELKAGVEAQLTKNATLWGNVGQQMGDKGYSDTAAMIGIKAQF